VDWIHPVMVSELDFFISCNSKMKPGL